DLLVPAVPAVLLFAARLGHFLGAAQRAAGLGDRLSRHRSIYNLQLGSYKGKTQMTDRPTHAGLRHLALNARDLPAMKQFYVDVLGFDVEWEPDSDNVYLSSGVDNLALHRAGGHTGPPLHHPEPPSRAGADPRAGPGA